MWSCALEPATKVHERDKQFGQVQVQVQEIIESTSLQGSVWLKSNMSCIQTIIEFFYAIFMCFAGIRILFLSVFPPYLQSAIEYCIDPGI